MAVKDFATAATVQTASRVYEEPDTSSRNLALKKGTQVYILATSGDWAMIEKDGNVGYTYLGYLQTSTAGSTEDGSDPFVPDGDVTGSTGNLEGSGSTAISGGSSVTIETVDAEVSSATLPVYASASTSSRKLGTLKAGQKVTVYAYNADWAYIGLNGKYGYLLDTGDYIVEPQFDKAGAFFGGFAAVCLDGKWGYIDEQGQMRIEPRFDDCGNFYSGSAEVELDGLCGLIDENGAYLIEPKYYGINSFEGNYATVARQGAYVEDDGSMGDYYEYIWGVIDRTGALVLPMEYDSIEIDADDSVAVATLGDETHYFHLSGGTAVEVARLGSSFALEDYYPNEGSKVVSLNETADIQWYADAALPRLDGATALLPVYAAVVQATYPQDVRYGEEEEDPLVTCTKTNRAYERLIEGAADVIFCAGPSEEQLWAAAAAGVELELTPFGAEAFVFTVNADNPLENITTEQIQGVYSGAITDWSELGVDGLGEIVAYQRPKNSGSQTALEKLMGDVELMTPPQQLVTDGMMDILENIEYRNLPNAIGYSFRFYCTEMVGSGVRLLSIDGVEPTVENIRSGAYPHVTTLYAVTRKGEDNPNVQILLDWLVSDQGQRLVEACGYVGNGEAQA